MIMYNKNPVLPWSPQSPDRSPVDYAGDIVLNRELTVTPRSKRNWNRFQKVWMIPRCAIPIFQFFVCLLKVEFMVLLIHS